MHQRLNSFLVAFMLMFVTKVSGQDKTFERQFVLMPQSGVFLKKDSIKLAIIAPDLYFRHTSIICKKEFFFEKSTQIPLKVRLGSLDYTNYLEKKPNALRPL
jgi:hypothetical protein